MEKKFTHRNNDYVARANTTDDEIQVGIFAQNNKRLYFISVSTEIANDAETMIEKLADNDAKTMIEKLVDYAIGDFKRLLDEGILNQ